MDWCYFGVVSGIVGLAIACISYGRVTVPLSEYHTMKKALIVACRIIRQSGTGLSKTEYDLLKTALGKDYYTIQDRPSR